MSANPIDEAVVQLRRLADVIRKHGTVPSLSLEHIANTLTAAQQQGQACECPIPVDDPPDMHAPGCVVRQPKQQGGGDVVAGTTLLFGNGAFIVNTGTFEGQHAAVFIDAAPEAGTVGAKAPPVSEGTTPLVRLVFPTREQAEAVCDALVSAPPSAPVGDDPIDASDNAEYIEHCADRLERRGLRVTAGALRVIAHEHRALAQQPAAEYKRQQPCGCVLCVCEDEKQCHGCGAKHCGNRTDHPAYVAQQPAAMDEAMAELRKLSALATQGELVARVIERGGQIIDAFLTVPSIEQGRTIAGPVPMEWLADDSYHEGGPEQKAHDARFTAAAVNYVRALATQHQEPTT